MSRDDTGGGGLLSKVVKFVRSPVSGWTDAEQDSGQESSYSKQMLKEMIERKRRNDFVRKREFDMLRKMRRSEVMAGQDPAARPSFFQSSLPSKPDDRATTLRKIDEIEAQMSMQWWKNKNGEPPRAGVGSSTNFPVSAHIPPDSLPQTPAAPAPAAAVSPAAYLKTAPVPLHRPAPEAPAAGTAHEPALELVSQPARAPRAEAAALVPPPVSPAPTGAPMPPVLTEVVSHVTTAPMPMRRETGAPSSFTNSKFAGYEVDDFAHDPEFEEASIRFANGDDAGAEAGLMEVLAPGGSRIDHDETWLALFDLYRATGQQERFETAAIDFAGRFGRSAPQWISLPEAVGRLGAAQTGASAAPAPTGQADWTSPGTFGTQSLATLNAALNRSPQPWRLSWAKLSSIDEAAVEPLTRQFSQWASQDIQLRFIGVEKLEQVLRTATPSGDKSVAPAWWKLRLEVLRVIHRPDEFELVALDYCVTYEVSPPSWEGARCEFKVLQADGSYAGGQTIVGEAYRDSMASGLATRGFGDTQTVGADSQQMTHVATVELAGTILGDATEAVALLEDRLAGADVMVISCARLIRIDFTAAGTLLNWVSARQAEGRQVQFVEVHRLVAAFFNVIGIGEHARIVARRD
jgi:anti-anti-sigma regulatory factor